MKYNEIQFSDLKASNIIMGNMRLVELSIKDAEALIRTALEQGINFFDHADIYGNYLGQSEEMFAEAIQMNSNIREEMILQSKCGIRPEGGYYDFSKEYIINSVDGILKRLKTEYLDVLLLHRPDPLMEPEEVAEAFEELRLKGKVRRFGVSNHNPSQIDLLQKHVPQKLIINQVQFGIAHTAMIDSNVMFNMNTDESSSRGGSLIEYSQLNEMTLQAWSPFQNGFFEGTFLGDRDKFPELNDVIDKIAAKYDVTNTAIATAWITRHPANIQVVLGTTNKQRLIDACAGSEIVLTRPEWYDIYKAAGNMVP